MVKQKRRQSSVGFGLNYNVAGQGVRESEDKDASAGTSTNMFRCSCNAGAIEEEFSVLREATSNALRQSLDEIEALKRDTATKVANIEKIQKVLDDLENEQSYVSVRTQKTEHQIEREKAPKKRLSFADFADAGRTLKGLGSRSMLASRNKLSMGEGLSTLSLNNRASHSRYSLNRTSQVHAAPTQPQDNSISPLDDDVCTSKNAEWPEPALVIIDDGDDDVSSESFNCASAADTKQLDLQSEEEINELEMKISQREETVTSLESTIHKNSEIIQDLQRQMISWKADNN
jgi:hypothetical protein